MCGICGIVNYRDGAPVNPDILAGMTRALTRRGPDDEGFYRSGYVGLGHRRLSIIDLATGRQPIPNEDRTVWIVYNGEMYNSPELRLDLEKSGHSFATATDTEVIVHAYEERGVDCPDILNGMFAFAIWDESERRLFIARDRVGLKPLYYADLDGVFLFGSELKALLAHPLVERRIDPQALAEYLTYEYVPTPRTIFDRMRKLPPGHSLTLENGRIAIRPYWDIDLSKSEEPDRRSDKEWPAELRSVLKESVRKELISDVSLGVLLSGGIDSSAIAAMMAELAPGNVESFSIAFEDPSFDESTHARLVADHLKTRHHELTLEPKTMLELVPQIAEILDEPLGDSSIIPTYLLSQFTRRHVKVALGGDGGDELFAGYSTLQAHKLFDYYRRLTPPVVRRLISGLVDRLPVSFDNISLDFKLRRFVSGDGLSPSERHHVWLGSFNRAQREALLTPHAEARRFDAADTALDHWNACSASHELNRVLYCDMKLYLEGDILTKVDRASMANSLEVRAPLLNKDMLDFAERLPLRHKLRGLTTKYLLRRAVEDRLPASILKRGKKGFNMPVAKWLTGPLKPLARDMFDPLRLKRIGLFDAEYVNKLMDEHLAGRKDNRKLLWTLLVFELWHERWART